MTGQSPLMDRPAIERALRALGDRLARRGVVADLYVVGGAAMALAYDARRITRDIDALVQPHGAVIAEARQVARDLDLPESWLNEQASVYVSTEPDPQAPRVFDHPNLRVAAASARHLLAMKVMAGRRRDGDDIRLLAGVLGLSTPQEVLAVVADVFPDEPAPARARPLLADVLGTEG